eukprot:CAMPEP_0184498478 /NCGR_PEP_ID=MMETSP0113_2-20130426/39096_1 /TAXON_ID=91329 /ORGANISM="Norrisiella sphaerica, Strain BC52" /LENGTH=1067 /DNA_ID=CAMNT_0026886005 /DNA_START=51 /DNA_END=3254 /DNA_ORIENTATION=+
MDVPNPTKAILRRKQLTSKQLARVLCKKGREYCNGVAELDASENKLVSQAFLKNFPELQEMNLSHNDIGDLEAQYFPIALKKCNLSYNKLPKTVGIGILVNLIELDLSHNDISDISHVGECKNLRKFIVSSNRISSINGLSTLKKLRMLDLSQNKISSTAALHPLAHNIALTHLDLLNNPVTKKPGNYRISIFHMLPHIRILDGSTTPGIGHKAASQVSQSARKTSNNSARRRPRRKQAETPMARKVRQQMIMEQSASSSQRFPVMTHQRGAEAESTQRSLQLEIEKLDEKLKSFNWDKSTPKSRRSANVPRDQSSVNLISPIEKSNFPMERLGPKQNTSIISYYSQTAPEVPEVSTPLNGRDSDSIGVKSASDSKSQLTSTIKTQAWDLVKTIEKELMNIDGSDHSPHSHHESEHQLAEKNDDGDTDCKGAVAPPQSLASTLASIAEEDKNSGSIVKQSQGNSPEFDKADDMLMLGLAYAFSEEDHAVDAEGKIKLLSVRKKHLEKLCETHMRLQAEKKLNLSSMRRSFERWTHMRKLRLQQRRETRLRRRIRTASTLWSIGLRFSQRAASGIEFSNFLEDVVRTSTRIFKPETIHDPTTGENFTTNTKVAVYLLDSEKPEEVLLISEDVSVCARFSRERGSSIAAHVCEDSEPILLEDATSSEMFNGGVDCAADTRFLKDRNRSLKPRLFCVPITSPVHNPGGKQGEVLGAVQAFGLHTAPFDTEEQKLVSGFAAQVAVGLSLVNRLNLLNQDVTCLIDAVDVADRAVGQDRQKKSDYQNFSGADGEIMDTVKSGGSYSPIRGTVEVDDAVQKAMDKLTRIAEVSKLKLSSSLHHILIKKDAALRMITLRALTAWRASARIKRESGQILKEVRQDYETCLKMLAEERRSNEKLRRTIERLHKEARASKVETIKILEQLKAAEGEGKVSTHAIQRSPSRIVQAQNILSQGKGVASAKRSDKTLSTDDGFSEVNIISGCDSAIANCQASDSVMTKARARQQARKVIEESKRSAIKKIIGNTASRKSSASAAVILSSLDAELRLAEADRRHIDRSEKEFLDSSLKKSE